MGTGKVPFTELFQNSYPFYIMNFACSTTYIIGDSKKTLSNLSVKNCSKASFLRDFQAEKIERWLLFGENISIQKLLQCGPIY